MTIYKNISKVVVEFKDREGLPSALIVEKLPEDAYAEIVVSDDGLTFDTWVPSNGQDSTPNAFHFKALEDWELKYVRRAGEDGQSVKKTAELGPVGKGVAMAILLALLSPVIWVIWDATIRWVQR